MRRRDFVKATATVGVVSVAGCSGGDGNPDVVLAEPDREFESSDVPYPAWGERIPDVTLPDPLADEPVGLRALEEPALLTFFYSHCKTVCPTLISTMRNVQSHAHSNGYADGVTFAPVTFDPERDDADRLRAYADRMNVDAAAADWHFLRPATTSRAETVVEEQFGVMFERTHPEDMEMYMFTHAALTLLVNADGYVERAYRTKTPDEETIIADLERVRTA
jgi:protein SCO1/2